MHISGGLIAVNDLYKLLMVHLLCHKNKTTFQESEPSKGVRKSLTRTYLSNVLRSRFYPKKELRRKKDDNTTLNYAAIIVKIPMSTTSNVVYN